MTRAAFFRLFEVRDFCLIFRAQCLKPINRAPREECAAFQPLLVIFQLLGGVEVSFVFFFLFYFRFFFFILFYRFIFIFLRIHCLFDYRFCMNSSGIYIFFWDSIYSV